MGWFFGKRSQNDRKVFDDDERELSLSVRRQKGELLRAKQELEMERLKLDTERIRQEIAEMRGDVDDEPEQPGNSMEQMLMGIVAAGMASKQQQAQPQPEQPPTLIELGKDEIQQIIDSFPKSQIKMFSKLPIETKAQLIRSKMPNIGINTINQAIQMLDGK